MTDLAPPRHFAWPTLRVRDARDVLAGSLFLAVGLTAAVLARGYALGTAMRMGPGYFPSLVGGLLALLGTLILLRGLRLGRALAPREATQVRQGLASLRPALLVGAGVAAFALLVTSAGMPLATLAMVLLGGHARPGARWRELLLLGALLAAFGTLLFVGGLGLNLPALPWGG